MKAYLALIGIDLKLALRLRTVIFFNYLFPIIFFFTFGTFLRAGQSVEGVTQVVTMSLTLGILGNGLFGAGIRTLQERELKLSQDVPGLLSFRRERGKSPVRRIDDE